MEKINKRNYEAYLLDFIEGNLGAEEQHDLFVFLAENPELKAEFEGGFGEIVLQPAPLVFDKKADLKVNDDELLTLSTVEARMIESVEGNLTKGQEKELDDFVKKHHLERTFAAYRAVVLKPDPGIVYGDKRGLKVRTGVVLPLYARIAAVAAVGILLIGIAVGRFSSPAAPVRTSQEVGLASHLHLAQPNEGPAVDPQNAVPPANTNVAGTDPGTIPFDFNRDERQPQKGIEQEQRFVKPDSVPMILPSPVHNAPVDFVDISTITDSITDDVLIEDELAQAAHPLVKSEEPYKLITDVAGNVINREVFFSRDKDLASNQYVAYQFKVGKFEFERKKSR